MTLSEAIEEVKQSAPDNWDWRAIATILNAVVKGQLTCK